MFTVHCNVCSSRECVSNISFKNMFVRVFICVQATEGEPQPMTEVDLFISTQRIKVLNADSQVLWAHRERASRALCTRLPVCIVSNTIILKFIHKNRFESFQSNICKSFHNLSFPYANLTNRADISAAILFHFLHCRKTCNECSKHSSCRRESKTTFKCFLACT